MSISFSLFVEFFRSTKLREIDVRTAQKYQNIVTLENEREALGFWSNLDQLQWLGFGLSVALKAFNRDQTLGLRSIIPLLSALYYRGQGEKHCFLATHLEYRISRFHASSASLQLSEDISQSLATQPSPC